MQANEAWTDLEKALFLPDIFGQLGSGAVIRGSQTNLTWEDHQLRCDMKFLTLFGSVCSVLIVRFALF